MTRRAILSGITFAGPNLQNISAYLPSLGIKGYTGRRRAKQFSALTSGAIIAAPWRDEITGQEAVVSGTPRMAVGTDGVRSINCITDSLAGFSEIVGPGSGTFFVVASPYGIQTNNNALITIGGRTFMRESSGFWTLKGSSGVGAMLQIPDSEFAVVNDRRMIVAITLSPDGAADEVRVVGGGFSAIRSGPVLKAAQASVKLGKPDAGGSANRGFAIFGEVRYAGKILTTAEKNLVITALAVEFGVAVPA